MSSPVGVLAVQGDFEKHLQAVADVGRTGMEVRTPEDLARVDRLILPGGESTTVGLLLQRYGLGEAIRRAAAEGMPLWGTCMGMILLAKEIEARRQFTLGLMDIAVRRNAFGAQVHSFEDAVELDGFERPLLGVFIRAPIVVRTGPEVQVLARYGDRIVAVRQGVRLGTSFHPELTEDRRLHEWFCRW
ncbi:MAG: pyridoxal 5'-phosphate synthase glutaminase subunit PdxT [Fimbriimonadales bacterium]|nr:pyridoxal 5'-phosphate synthase glutaminase subunit PdxT [Fimbriimonadales bacterium]